MSLPPKKLENALYYDANNNVTIRTDAVGGGGGIASSVSVSNFPANQAVVGNVNVTSGSVSISNFPATQNVAIASGTNNIGLVKITDNTGTGITSTTLSGKQRLDVNLAAGGVPATTAPNWADQVAGVDKSGNLRVLSVDINGNLNVNASTTSNLSIQNPVDISVTGTLGSLNATVPINIKGVSSLYAVVTGTWSGTINWYGSVDGITFVPLIVAAGGPTNVYSTAGITTNAGVRIAIPSGFTIINATMTAYTSGSAQITMNASNGTAVTESIQLNPANFKATVIGNVNVSAGSLSINNFPTTQNVQLADSAIFVSNAAVSLFGASQWFDTTTYGSISIQLVNFEFGTITIEGSNDGVTANPLLILPVNDFNYIDSITSTGLYSVKTTSQYIRYNVINNQGGTFGLYMIGRNSQGPSAADALSMAMSGEQNIPLNVNLKSGLKIDTASGALVFADAVNPNPQGLMYLGAVNTITVIDTTGYNSLNVTTMAYAGSVTASNDGITWVSLGGLAITGASTALVTAVTATSSFSFPCMARYVRFTCTIAGQFTVYLRQQLFSPNYLTNQTNNLTQIAGAAVSATTAQLGMNIVQMGGTATVTGGLAGTLGIGGASAAGVVPTYNFLGVGGIDSAGLMRRLLTDASGRLTITGTNPNINTASTTPAQSIGAILGTMQNNAALNIQDTTQFEGQTVVELLAQLLLEIRITNHILHELPLSLNNGFYNVIDEPVALRNDPTIFAQ